MVDLDGLNWEGWLDEATFFPAAEHPTDSLNLDELLTYQKLGTDNDVDPIADLPELNWLDEKVDISVFNPELILDDGQDFSDAFSLFLDSVAYDPHTFCPPPEESPKINPTSSSTELNFPNITDSPNGGTDILLGSPFYEPISAPTSPINFETNPAQIEDQFCLSPNSSSYYASSPDMVIADDFVRSPEAASSYCSTPRGSLSADDFNPGDQDLIINFFQNNSIMQTDEVFVATTEASQDGNENTTLPNVSGVSVEVCSEEEPAPAVEETLSIEEVTASMRRKRYVNDGKAIPKVQVSLRNIFHPYERTTTTVRKPRDKVQRKKVQNKEAAARYRVKKRNEEKELSGEVEGLESEQRELQQKHDALASEIKYLKSLMREMLQKKGILK